MRVIVQKQVSSTSTFQAEFESKRYACFAHPWTAEQDAYFEVMCIECSTPDDHAVVWQGPSTAFTILITAVLRHEGDAHSPVSTTEAR